MHPADFGWALQMLKNGSKVQRTGWNGKGMYVYLVPPTNVPSPPPTTLPYIMLKTANNEVVPWTISQTDALADDWQVVE